MIKLIKEKFLVSLVVIVMLVLAVGSVNSLATSPLIPTNSASKNNTAGDALTNNNTADVGATDSVGAGPNSSNTNSNRSRNNTTNTNTSNKTNTNTNKAKSNTENESSSGKKLPYAGTNGTVVFVVVALALSAVYAYKKVSDYNI